MCVLIIICLCMHYIDIISAYICVYIHLWMDNSWIDMTDIDFSPQLMCQVAVGEPSTSLSFPTWEIPKSWRFLVDTTRLAAMKKRFAPL